MAVELKGVWTVIKRDGNRRFIRAVLAICVSFAFCCVWMLPLVAAFTVAVGCEDDPLANEEGLDAWPICFWALFAASVGAAAVFDSWFKRRLRKRKAPNRTSVGDV